MTRPTERAAAQRAVEAWKLRRSAEPIAEGYDFDAVVELSGVAADTLDLWVECGLVDTSLTQDGDDEYRFSAVDLLRAMILADLIAVGVPGLVVALAATSHTFDFDYADEPEPDTLLARIADDTRHAVVYPCSAELAEAWYFGDGIGCVTRHVRSPERLAEVESWSHERAAELAAEADETRRCVEHGEAVEYRPWETAARLQRRLAAWWVEQASRSAARGNR